MKNKGSYVNSVVLGLERVNRALEVAGEALHAASHFSISQLLIARQRPSETEEQEIEQQTPARLSPPSAP